MRAVDVRDQPLQRSLAAVVRGEEGDLRLECAGELRRRVDDVAAEVEQRVRIVHQRLGESRRVRIEPDAEQAVGITPAPAELVDEVHAGLPEGSVSTIGPAAVTTTVCSNCAPWPRRQVSDQPSAASSAALQWVERKGSIVIT